MQVWKLRRTSAPALESLENRRLLSVATVNINTSTTFQTIEGFGAGMVTWTKRAEYEDPAFYDRIVNDLGATMARTAIWPTFEQSNDNADPNAFNWAGYDKASIAQAMTFLKRLQDRGANKFLATVWTSPAWMKTNQLLYHGGTVRPENRAELAEYLAATVISAKRDFGVDLSMVSPQNEPFFSAPFESGQYTPEQLRETVRAVMRKFDREGLSTGLLLPEDLSKAQRYDWYLDPLMKDPETSQFKGAFGVHTSGTPEWAGIHNVVRDFDQPLWMSESSGHSNTWSGVKRLASFINDSLTVANATAFLYWQYSEPASRADGALMIDGTPTIKYHAAKQYFRYIRPGAKRVKADSSDANLKVSSFRHPTTGAHTIVLVNLGAEAADVTFNQSGSNLPARYKAYQTAEGVNHVRLADVAGGASFRTTIPASSIVTLYSGPDLVAKTATSGGPMPEIKPLIDAAFTNPLRRAAADGNLAEVVDELSKGSDPNRSFGGYSALHVAAASVYDAQPQIIRELVAKGANVNAVSTDGYTPLHMAAATVWTRNSDGPLAVEKLRALIQSGASLEAKDPNGRTAMHWAALMPKPGGELTQDPTAVQFLIDSGAKINATDARGWTPLDYALSEGNLAGAAALRAAGAVTGGGSTDTTAPTADVIDVSPDPRVGGIDVVDVRFSEAVSGVGLVDFTLTRDGGANLLAGSGATVAKVNSTTYRISGLSSLTATPGTYLLKLWASGSGITDLSGNALATSASDTFSVTAAPTPVSQAPFNGSPYAIGSTPVTIEAEHYDLGGEGVAYHDSDANNNGGASFRLSEGVDLKATTDVGGGYRVNGTLAGEWLEYTVNVAAEGRYRLDARVSSNGAGGVFAMWTGGGGGLDLTGPLRIPNTGGNDAFTTLSLNVFLPAGEQVLRLAMYENSTSTGGVGNFNWIRLSPATATPSAAAVVNTDAASYVRNGGYASTNFDGEADLVVKSGSTTGSSRQSYLKFDLSSLTAISSAKLRLFGRLSHAAPAVTTALYYSANTSWSENSITWNNKPPSVAKLGSMTISGSAGAWYEFDVTNFLKAEKAAGRNVVTFVLFNPATSDAQVLFNSDDASANRPQIAVTA